MNVAFYDQNGNKTTNLESAVSWKSGAVFGIVSAEVIPHILPDELLFKRAIFQDFYVPFLDWQKIRTVDLWIAGWNHPLVLGHFSLWNANLPLNAKRPIETDVVTYEKLKRELNAEFFLKLGALLDQLAQGYLKSLLPEATAKYTLEGILRTLHQEMTSPLLKRRMEKINEMKLVLFSNEIKHENPFLHEKVLVSERLALEENLAALEELANQIGDDLPCFSSFQLLLSSESWEKREGALSLLAKELDLQLVLIGNPLEKQVQSALQVIL